MPRSITDLSKGVCREFPICTCIIFVCIMSRYNVPRDQSICIKNGQQLNQNQFFMFISLLMLLGLIVRDVKFLTRHSLLSLFLCILQSQMLRCVNMRICMRSLRWSKAAGQRRRSLPPMYVRYYQTKLLALQY